MYGAAYGAAGSSVGETRTSYNGQELYALDVSITGLSAALYATLAGGFDAFWAPVIAPTARSLRKSEAACAPRCPNRLRSCWRPWVCGWSSASR